MGDKLNVKLIHYNVLGHNKPLKEPHLVALLVSGIVLEAGIHHTRMVMKVESSV